MGTAQAFDETYYSFYRSAVFERNVSSLAALVLLSCEFVANLDDELQHIWRRPLNRVNWIYFVARYLALLGLTINTVLVIAGPISTMPVHVAHCQAWFTMLSVISCLVLFAIDAIAMLRVYALYNCNIKVGAFFSSLLITEATLVTTCCSTTVGVVPFSPICDVEQTPFQVIYFAGGVVFAQISLLFFTFRKWREMAGQRDIPLIKLVFREGAWMSTLICGIFLFTVPYSLATGTSKPHIVLVWPTALLSVAACRVILNMHQLPALDQPTQSTRTSQQTGTNIQFTSFLNLSQARTFDQCTLPDYGSGSGHDSPSLSLESTEQRDDDRQSGEMGPSDTLSSLSLALSTHSPPPPPPPFPTRPSGILLRPDSG